LSQAPIIDSFAPKAGIPATPVILMGKFFSGTHAVCFNGTPAPSFTVVNGTTILTLVPSGATSGEILVTTDGGTATSIAPFSVVQR
jgi:hypothetical protein